MQALLRSWRQLEVYDREEDVYLDIFQKVVFNEALHANLRVVQWLASTDYMPFPFYVMYIPKKAGLRPKVWTTPQDGILAQTWVNTHGVDLEKHMPSESLGYRLESQDGDRIFRPWQSAFHLYTGRTERFTFLPGASHFIKTDLSNFYPSIDLDLLEGELGCYVRDPEALSRMRSFIHYRIKDPNTGRVEQIERGVAQGPPYSRVLANLYLLRLDRHLRNNSLAFVRYVDDFVVLYGTKEEASRQLSKIDWVLEDLHLTRNIDKTKGPSLVSDEGLLLDEVFRMRSEAEDLIQGVNLLDAGAQKDKLAQGLYTYFSRVVSGNEKDLLAAAKWLSFVLRNQQRIGAGASVLKRTVASVQLALEAGLQNVKTLRSIFRGLLRQGDGDLPTPGLHRVVQRADDHAKIAFCEICGVVPIKDAVYSTLATLAGETERPFVRAAALMAFYQHQHLVPTEVLTRAINQKNTFLLARALLCLSLVPKVPVYPSLVPHVQSDDPEVVASALLVAVRSADAASHLLLHQVPLSAFKRVEVITLFVRLALWLGRPDALRRLTDEAGLPLDVIGDIIEAQLARTDDLTVLLGVLQEGIKIPEPIRGDILDFVYYRLEAIYPSEQDRPIEVRYWLRLRGRTGGWPQADPRLAGIRSSSIRYLAVPGATKWDPQERIPAKRFPGGTGPEAWLDSLRTTCGQFLCPFDSRVEDGPSGRALVIDYRIPDGYRLLSDVLKESGSLSYASALRLASRLAEATPYAIPLDPFHVLVNPNMEFRLIAVGGALEAITYSGVTSSIDDTSPAANIRFLGLLLFHVVTGVCPLTEEGELSKERTGSRILMGSKRIEMYPHFKIIFAKCIEPDYRERYDNPVFLQDDVDAALSFVQWKSSGFIGNLALGLEKMERLHATGLQIKHMLASHGLAREGSVVHSERIVSHLILSLSKLAWTPDRRFRWRIGHPGPRSRVLRMFYDVAEHLNDLHDKLSSDEWSFIKRVATCLAYWALRIELGRYLRGITEPHDLSGVSEEVKRAAAELLLEPIKGRSVHIQLSDEVLESPPLVLAEAEQGCAASQRTDYHRYDLANDLGLRACALFVLFTASDQRFTINYADRYTQIQGKRVDNVRLSPNSVEWLVKRLWHLQPQVDHLLSPQAVTNEELDRLAASCWEATSVLEGALRRPRFSTHLARIKATGEMGSYVRLLNLPFALSYRYNQIANIDPETERPVTRDKSERVEVDLHGWLRPQVLSVLFEPLPMRTILGTSDSAWYKVRRSFSRHAPTVGALTVVFWMTLQYVRVEEPNVIQFLMVGLSANILGVIIDRVIAAALSRTDVE